MAICALAGVALLVVGGAASAADWPQWRGPERNGVSRETGWLDTWPTNTAPRVAWRAVIGKGHLTAAVSGGRVFSMGWDGTQDTVFCFDAASGRLIWKQSYPCKTILQWPGPRATPTVDEDTVYTLGQHGQLFAWDSATGARRWHVPLAESYNPDVDYWLRLVAASRWSVAAPGLWPRRTGTFQARRPLCLGQRWPARRLRFHKPTPPLPLTAVCTVNATTFLATASGGSYRSPAVAMASGDRGWFSAATV